MGTNYGEFLAEAVRVLRQKGQIWIAEVRSRFVDVDGREEYGPFQKALRQAGIKVNTQDNSNQMFVVFEARKASKQASSAVHWPQLKACQYKRR